MLKNGNNYIYLNNDTDLIKKNIFKKILKNNFNIQNNNDILRKIIKIIILINLIKYKAIKYKCK